MTGKRKCHSESNGFVAAAEKKVSMVHSRLDYANSVVHMVKQTLKDCGLYKILLIVWF